MIWASWHDFFAMGGYAFYIWGSVLMVAGVMIGEIILVRLRSNAIHKQIAQAGSVRVRRKE